MKNSVRWILGGVWLGISVAGCQGIPAFLAPGSLSDGNSPFSGSGLIANNSASLSGQVLAPSSLVANNSASLIGNNSASLIGNNSAALVSNNAAAYRTSAIQELPVIKAVVEAVRDGQVVSRATTDETGHYSLPNLTKERAYLLRVTFNLDGQNFQELAIARTVTLSGHMVNSASTLVTAKVVTQGVLLDQVNMAKYYETVNLVTASQTSLASAALTSTQESSNAFDQLGQSNQQVTTTFTETITPSATTTSNPTPTPSSTPAGTTYDPKDYFYPPSATAEGTFLTTSTTVYPASSGLSTEVSTSSFSVAVANYTASSATLRRTVGGITLDSALSLLTGQVKIDTMTLGASVFTPEGGVVTPYGAVDTVRYSLLAADQAVSVKAGSYTCVKLQETTTGQNPSLRTLWYAKGIGLGPVKILTTMLETTADGTATHSVVTELQSFKP